MSEKIRTFVYMKGIWEQIARSFIVDAPPPPPAGFRAEEGAPRYGQESLGLPRWQLREAVQAGLPWTLLDDVKTAMTWTDAQLARYLRMSEKTLQRSRAAERDLGADAAEKIIDLGAILSAGMHTFGNRANFLGWLRTPLLPFQDETPESCLFDEPGRRMVEEEIERIEWGLWT